MVNPLLIDLSRSGTFCLAVILSSQELRQHRQGLREYRQGARQCYSNAAVIVPGHLLQWFPDY
jgi:hypothetical protein